MCSVSSAKRCVLPNGPTPLRESPPLPFIDTRRDGVHAQGIMEVVVFSPNRGDVLLSRGQARYPRARRRRGAWSRASAGSPRARRRSPRGSEGVRTGRTAYVGHVLGFFESFPFFQIRRVLRAFVDPIALHAFVFRAILVPLLGCP